MEATTNVNEPKPMLVKQLRKLKMRIKGLKLQNQQATRRLQQAQAEAAARAEEEERRNYRNPEDGEEEEEHEDREGTPESESYEDPPNPEEVRRNLLAMGKTPVTFTLSELVNTIQKREPDMSKHYQQPKQLDRPSIPELRQWIKDLQLYVTEQNPVCVAKGMEAYMFGRTTGYLQQVTMSSIRKLKRENKFVDCFETYKQIWFRAFGLSDPDDYARTQLNNLKFNFGNLSAHFMKLDALYEEMEEDPLSQRDRVTYALNSITPEALREKLTFRPGNGLR